MASLPEPLSLAPEPTRIAHVRPADGGRPLHVLHVVRQYMPAIGGLETYVALLARQQRAAGHRVEVLTLDRVFHGDGRRLAAEEMIDGVRVVRLPWKGPQRYPLAPGAVARLGAADIVHIHGVDSFVDCLAATRIIHRKPLVLSTHGGFFHSDFAPRAKRMFFHTVTRCSLLAMRAVLASSAQDQQAFARLAGSKAVLVENGVDLTRFRGLAAADQNRIVYFGRLAPNKGLDRLVAWFAALHRHDPSWSLVIAGRPSGVDADMVRLAVDRLGLSSSVEIYPSPTDETIAAIIERSSVYACASSYEGFGIAAVEAASAGLYPVLSDIPPFARTRMRLGFGTLVDFAAPADPAAFLADLRRYRADRPGQDELDRALAPFDWCSVAREVESVYRKVLGDGVHHVGRVDIQVARRETALARIMDAIAAREPTVIAFCNAHTVNLASRNPALAGVLKKAIIYNDGVGVGIAARLLYGRAFPANLNGTDLIPDLLERLPPGTRLFLVGSAPGVAAKAGAEFERRYPQIAVVGTQHGFLAVEEEPALVQRIVASRADLVLVGMGQPRQEFWAATHVARLDRPVLCVGGLLDFTARVVPRAPLPFRRLGLEWAFRLMMEPRRLARRYVVGNGRFLAGIFWQWATNRRASG
ncbi:WecB/TagA/CpsF family glycosyltransferase [uncultured Sphingomonas sp.]|uniref:WecB/TagA/CpsF family glycosyltransferase n=1 Tax=uncultured Sphingomonas sp. TaxID=158754 RepID=UPI0035CC0BA3